MKINTVKSKPEIIVLRSVLAIIFLAHALVRLFNGSLVQFGGFLSAKHIPFGYAVVWGITIFEIIGGIMLLLGLKKRLVSAGFILLLIAGIILIHASLGWFVGEHGTGGVEYSIVLIAALSVIYFENRQPE